MGSFLPNLESTAVKLALAFAAYASDSIRIVERDLTGYTHILASRQGLYVVDRHRVTLILHGFFFGVTIRGEEIFVFEACDLPRHPTRQGRILRLLVHGNQLIEATIVCKGLDNGCHQIDFVGPCLHVIDTYHQQILRFAPGEQTFEILNPLPPVVYRAGEPSYVHCNSILAVGDRIMLLLHNGAQHTGRKSEIAAYTRDWEPLGHTTLAGSGCHGLALLPDGSLLTCGSMEGNLITNAGFKLHISPYMTRGLAVGLDSIAVGASRLAERAGRMHNTGTVTFLDRRYEVEAVLEVPGAPTELRRLDGKDAGLSNSLLNQNDRGRITPTPTRYA